MLYDLLFKTQRNELLNILQNCSIPLSIIVESQKQDEYILTVRESYFYSTILPMRNNSLGGDFSVKSTPKVPDLDLAWGEGYSWKELVTSFTGWTDEITNDLSTPDLWAEAAKTAQLFTPTAEPSNDKFNRTELAEVQGQLRLLQLSFTQSALPEAAKQKLIELTQTAAVKAEGLTKKDWQNWIIGGFISAITGLALNPTQAGEVLKLVKAAFGGLFLH